MVTIDNELALLHFMMCGEQTLMKIEMLERLMGLCMSMHKTLGEVGEFFEHVFLTNFCNARVAAVRG